MPGHDIIVVGASAGGVEALKQLVAEIPADLPAAIFVVLHMPAHFDSVLPQILTRAGTLPAVHPVDGAPIEHGCIYVAAPDRHLLVEEGRVRLSRGPHVHGLRPAIDPLFRSAAVAYGSRVVGVVLTGTLTDGTAGLLIIKTQGGVSIVQDPGQADYPEMPESAIAHAGADHVLPLKAIPAELVRLVQTETTEGGEHMPLDEQAQTELIDKDFAEQERGERANQPSVFTCPECGGVLWELKEGQLIEYRCHVGHVYSPDDLRAAQSEVIEAALWSAIRSLRERYALLERLALHAADQGRTLAFERFDREARQAAADVAVLRSLVVNGRDQGISG